MCIRDRIVFLQLGPPPSPNKNLGIVREWSQYEQWTSSTKEDKFWCRFWLGNCLVECTVSSFPPILSLPMEHLNNLGWNTNDGTNDINGSTYDCCVTQDDSWWWGNGIRNVRLVIQFASYMHSDCMSLSIQNWRFFVQIILLSYGFTVVVVQIVGFVAQSITKHAQPIYKLMHLKPRFNWGGKGDD